MVKIKKTVFKIPECCKGCPIALNPIYGVCKNCKHFPEVEEYLEEPEDYEVV